MKITKRQLRKIIKEEKARLLKEEPADCIRDYIAMGYSRAQAYKECDDGSEYSRVVSRSRPQRKTSFVGEAANADQIAAVEAALSAKPNNFLTSVLNQLKNGRGLSDKQKLIVKNIMMKSNAQAASLFEGTAASEVTRRQLRKIVKAAKTSVLREQATHMSGRNQNVMGQLHTAIDALIEELGIEDAQMELQGIVDEMETEKAISARYNEGTSLKEMPASWHQVLGQCLDEKL